MKFVVATEPPKRRAFGGDRAVFILNRRYYYAALSILDNSVISIETEYKTKKKPRLPPST